MLTVRFEVEDPTLLALHGGPAFAFGEAISPSVDCADQAEVDRLWKQLTEGGTESQCGWRQDRGGLPWQIVPMVLTRMLQGPDSPGVRRVMQAMFGMARLDLARWQAACDGA